MGSTRSESLVDGGGLAAYPRWSRDGRLIAYAHNDRRSTPVLRVIEAGTGTEVWSERRNTSAAAAWLPDGSLLTSDLEFCDRDHLYLRLERVAPAGASSLPVRATPAQPSATRPGGATSAATSASGDITLGSRLQDADVSADGTRGIAVENGGGSNRLVSFDPRTGEAAALTAFAADVHWAEPRWSPRGDLIAVSRWSAGGPRCRHPGPNRADQQGRTASSTLRRGRGRALGGVLLPDRTGIPNLYAYDRQQARAFSE
jgi:dipeptidyl aminopeptidase/acylaminoacyl peptidase